MSSHTVATTTTIIVVVILLYTGTGRRENGEWLSSLRIIERRKTQKSTCCSRTIAAARTNDLKISKENENVRLTRNSRYKVPAERIRKWKNILMYSYICTDTAAADSIRIIVSAYYKKDLRISVDVRSILYLRPSQSSPTLQMQVRAPSYGTYIINTRRIYSVIISA